MIFTKIQRKFCQISQKMAINKFTFMHRGIKKFTFMHRGTPKVYVYA